MLFISHLFIKFYKKIFLSFFVFFTFCSCFASKPFNKVTIDYEKNNKNLNIFKDEIFFIQMQNVAQPFLDSNIKTGFIETPDNNQLYYETFFLPESKGTILLIHGFTSFTRKFDEITYYFLTQGYNIVRYDQRGHGFSSREIKDSLSKVHIDDFKTYVDDASLIYNEILLPNSENKPIFLFAHSMGGCVGSLLIEEYPEYFDAAILNAPMMGINLLGIPKPIVKAFVNAAIGFNKGASFAFDHQEFIPNEKVEIKKSSTKSKARYLYVSDLRNENIYYQTNGATFSWVNAALEATGNIFKPKQLKKINIPILIVQAEKDNLVSPKAQDKFARRTENTKIIFMPQVEHDTFNSKEDFLQAYYFELFNFLEENL